MTTKELILKWGLIGGAISIIMSLLSYLIGLSDSKAIQYFGWILMLAIIVLALFEYRDKLGSGFASFGELFKAGILIGLIIALISTIWSVINVTYIDTDFLNRILLNVEIDLENKGLSDKDIKNAMDMTKKYMTPIYMSIMELASLLISSAVISGISALVIKNTKPFASIED